MSDTDRQSERAKFITALLENLKQSRSEYEEPQKLYCGMAHLISLILIEPDTPLNNLAETIPTIPDHYRYRLVAKFLEINRKVVVFRHSPQEEHYLFAVLWAEVTNHATALIYKEFSAHITSRESI